MLGREERCRETNMKITSGLKLSLLIDVALVGCLVWQHQKLDRVHKSEVINQKLSIDKELSNIEKPLSTLTIMRLTEDCDLYYIINSDSIWFDEFEKDCKSYNFSIYKDQYPKLFKQGIANSSFISVEKDRDQDTTLTISNYQPNHGGYTPVYQLTVDLNTLKISEKAQ